MSQNNLINAVENWLLNYQDILEAKKEESRHGSRIVVSDAASRLAFIYEKIRKTVVSPRRATKVLIWLAHLLKSSFVLAIWPITPCRSR